MAECERCTGTGWVDADPPADAGATAGVWVRRCPICEGKGRIAAAIAPPAPDPADAPDAGAIARAYIAEGRRLLARPPPPPPAPPAQPRKTSTEGGQS